MRVLPWPLRATIPALFAVACDTSVQPELTNTASVTEAPGDAAVGLIAFTDECAGCHAARDGFDLAFFSFPDSAIVRRALAHVDTTTARDIAAYIAALEVPAVDRHTRIFQPGGRRLDGDVAFAVELFGGDVWPAGLTSADLLAIDPVDVPVALAFPEWSVEESDLDWMPDRPLPPSILAFDGDGVRRALGEYYRTGTDASLARAVLALRTADRSPTNAEAPCLVEDAARFDPETCFEVRRWTSSLFAQHMLRTGRSGPVHPLLHGAWWDVGNAARKSIQHGVPIESAEESWALWMSMGWAFAPERHASVYLATGLSRLGLYRHGTFTALRSQVARAPERGDAYMDLATATRFAPPHWLVEAARFGYEHLIERLEAGDVPSAAPFPRIRDGAPESHLDMARRGLTQARALLERRLSRAEAAELLVLHERVLGLLPAE